MGAGAAGLGLTGTGDCGGASTRVFTSWGSTKSAVRRRPPFGGHCRLYKAFRVAMASSPDEYYIKTKSSCQTPSYNKDFNRNATFYA